MHKAIEIPTLKLRGYGELQLLNERGRVVYKEPFENFVSIPAQNEMKWAGRSRTNYNHNANTSGYANYDAIYSAEWGPHNSQLDLAPSWLFGGVYLSDSVAAEVPSSEQLVPGNILGWGAWNTTWTSGTANRGTAQTAFWDSTKSSSTYRWEWTTAQANGVIGSVGFCQANAPSKLTAYTDYSALETGAPDLMVIYINIENDINKLVTGGIRQSDGVLFEISNSDQRTLYKSTDSTWLYNYSLGTSQGQFPQAVGDMCIDGNGYAWAIYLGTAYSIVKVSPTAPATVLSTFTKPWAGSFGGYICADSTYYYCIEADSGAVGTSATRTVYKRDQADGSAVTSWTHTITGPLANAQILGMYYDFTNSKIAVVEASGTDDPTNANHQRVRITYYTTAGVFFGETWMDEDNYHATGGTIDSFEGSQIVDNHRFFAEYQGILASCYSGNYDNDTGTTSYRFRTHTHANLGTRTLLASPVTKTSSNSARLDYTLAYS